jgi:putative membrane protein
MGMKKVGPKFQSIYLGLIGFSIFGIVLTRLTGLNAGPIAPLSAALVILVGTALIVRELGFAGAAAIAGIGAASEIVGVYTGLPYGHYAYTDAWLPTIALPGDQLFPLLLPLAWVLVVGGVYVSLGRRSRHAVLITGLLAAGIDLAMEPVVTRQLGYWQWSDLAWPIGVAPGEASPLLNSVGWFAVAALATVAASRLDARKRPSPVGSIVVGAYILLMAVIGFADASGAPLAVIAAAFGLALLYDRRKGKKTR